MPTPTPQIQSPTPSPTPDETAGWQTYRNEEYGFEFKYPKKFVQVSATELDTLVALRDSSNSKPRISTLPDIFLRVLPIPVGSNFGDVLIQNAVYGGSGLHPKSLGEFSQEKIGYHTFYVIETGLFEGVLSMNYYLVAQDRIFVFPLVSNPVDWTNPDFDPAKDSLNRDLQKIISTFSVE